MTQANNSQSALETAIVTSAPTVDATQATVERGWEAVSQLFVYDEYDNASLAADSELKASELLTFVTEKGNKLGSETTRLANVVRLARALPKVKEGELEVPAYDWVIVKLRANAASGPAIANTLGLIPALDIRDANNLPATLSVFAVKNAMGWINERGLVDAAGKFVPAAEKDFVVQSLKAGVGATKLARDIAERRQFEKAAAKKPAALPATAAPETPATPTPATGSETPATPTPATETPSTETVATAAPEAASAVSPDDVVPRGLDNADKVALDMRIIVQRVDALNVRDGVKPTRDALKEAFSELATMMGFDLKPIRSGNGK